MARQLSGREKGLALLLVGATAWVVWSQATKQIGPSSADIAIEKAKEASVESAPVVRMDLLERESDSFDGGRRDLFQYSVRPPTAAELRARRDEEERERLRRELEAKANAEAAARMAEDRERRAKELAINPPKPPAPPIQLKYLGYFGPKTDKIAAFEDGEEVLVAKQGDIVKGQFRVVEIRYESVVMGYTNPQFRNETRELAMAPAAPR
jgi:hypothetical protein